MRALYFLLAGIIDMFRYLNYGLSAVLIFVGVNLGGYVGWELGEQFGTMAAFVLSGAGSVLGVVAGWWAARRYLA